MQSGVAQERRKQLSLTQERLKEVLLEQGLLPAAQAVTATWYTGASAADGRQTVLFYNDALMWRSCAFTTSGAVIKREKHSRRSIALDVFMQQGETRDLLRLATKGDPFMEGQVSLKAKIDMLLRRLNSSTGGALASYAKP